MSRYICIHGHFYQPPRENPWLEAIEIQDSAHPYHDWNERITDECYATNASSRILDAQGRISRIVNNYARISFNFGPTLLSWLEDHSPQTYEALRRADKLSQERFGGHGAALAQVYNHAIMPLANTRDKRTQVIWGVRDFEHRFGRKPEGMWLAETAVDLETLEILAEHGVKFTILAPHQASKVKLATDTAWLPATAGRIDPRKPYLQRLPSGATIAIFFYDGPISQAVAFERLLDRGERLASRLTNAFDPRVSGPQLVHIATDGETYGHHHRHGEMALSYALELIEAQSQATLTIYGQYLELYPPQDEVQIMERTAWSCAHGVERWRSDCGCSTGSNPGWRQRWRQPLREALDWLRDELSPRYEQAMRLHVKDPWAARDAYIEVILDRSPATLERFLAEHALAPLDDEAKTCVLELLELQRHAQLMYTSCGWFFDDIAGIETVQILQYAARVLQLAKLQLEVELEEGFLSRLAQAPCNHADFKDGQEVYLAQVSPTVLALRRVCAHYAIESLFHDNRHSYCYEITSLKRRVHDSGRMRMAMGVAQITSKITLRSQTLEYAVLHMGDHNVTGGTRPQVEPEQLEVAYQEALNAFERAEIPALIRLLDRHFGQHVFTLRSLFRDEQRRVIDRVMSSAVDDAEVVFRELYENRAPLMHFLTALGTPLPKPFLAAASVALNQSLRRLFESDAPPPDELHALLQEANKIKVELDWRTLSFTAHAYMMRFLEAFSKEPTSLIAIDQLYQAISLVLKLPFEVSLRECQDVFMEVAETRWPAQNQHREDLTIARWCETFAQLAALLQISPQIFARFA